MNEARAYETTLRLGKTTASQISKESRVPYGRIYVVLSSLEEKGLVRIVPEETKKYVATDPQKLHELVTERIKGLKDIDDKITEFKQMYDQQTEEPVMMVQGKNSFHKINKELISPRIYSYAVKYNWSIRPEFIRNTKEHMKKNIDSRTIGRFDKETAGALKKWIKINKNIRPIENEGIAMSIQDDKEVMIGLIKSNTTMLINDASFAKLMKKLFLSYYETHDENGKKINWKK